MTFTNGFSAPCESCQEPLTMHLHKPDVDAAVDVLVLCPTCDPPCGWCEAEKAMG